MNTYKVVSDYPDSARVFFFKCIVTIDGLVLAALPGHEIRNDRSEMCVSLSCRTHLLRYSGIFVHHPLAGS